VERDEHGLILSRFGQVLLVAVVCSTEGQPG
jgi:hypothetical protein